jgi:hypothetical protein
MSPISFFQRHPRADFSAYLDGELTAAAARRIRAHASACPECTAEIEDLRVTRAVLREMPKASAPRSFAMTPEMAREARPARVVPAQPRLQPLVNGLRMTSAGLAAALVVVMVIAIGGNGSDSGDDSGSDTAAANLQLDRSSDDYSTIPSASTADDGSSEFATTAAPSIGDTLPTPTTGSGGGGVGGIGGVGGSGGGVGAPGDTGGEAVPQATDDLHSSAPDATVTPPELISGQYDDGDGDSATDDSKSVDGDEDALPETGAAADSDGGGASTLSVVALVLGVLLGGALIGSIAASRLSQNTP